MSMHITPDKTVPYPDSLEPEVASTLRENMQIASNTAEVLKGLGAQVDDDPEAPDKAGEVFKLMRLYGGRETAIDVDLDKEFGPTLEIEMVEEVEPDEPAPPAEPDEDIPNA
jgi:hypothetical protein